MSMSISHSFVFFTGLFGMIQTVKSVTIGTFRIDGDERKKKGFCLQQHVQIYEQKQSNKKKFETPKIKMIQHFRTRIFD